MSDLSELIQQYKDNPTDEIKDKLISLVIAQEDARRSETDSVEGWTEFSNGIRVRKRKSMVYEIIEIYALPCEQYFCYQYLVNLGDYSAEQKQDLRENNAEYIDETDDEECLIAMAIAAARNVDEKDIACIADGEQEMLCWYRNQEGISKNNFGEGSKNDLHM